MNTEALKSQTVIDAAATIAAAIKAAHAAYRPTPVIWKTHQYATMVTEALKSTGITGLDATPRTKLAGGAGAPNGLQEVSGTITTTTGKTTGSTYQLVRVKTTAYIKDILLSCAAMAGSSAADFGVYYSDTDDGTAKAVQGTVVDADFFASAVDLSSALKDSVITNESGTYTLDKRIQPLWQAVGLSSDPGGYFDIVATSTATINTGALMGISVRFTTV